MGAAQVRKITPSGSFVQPIAWLDEVVGFLALERGIILRNLRITSNGSLFTALRSAQRQFILIAAHGYFFYLISRPMPGAISYMNYNLGSFTSWFVFSMLFHHGAPSTITGYFNKNLNIKWAHLFIADVTWEFVKIILLLIVSIVLFSIINIRYLYTFLMPNFPLLFCCYAIAAGLGCGLGLIVTTASKRWPFATLSVEVVIWMLFVSSGIYTSYCNLPWQAAQYAWFSPLVAVIEYSRNALDPTYPVMDLSLIYSAAVAGVALFLGLAYRRWEQKAQMR